MGGSRGHLFVHFVCYRLVGQRHVGVRGREHALHQAALPLPQVLHRRGQRQVGEAGEVRVGAVQQVVQPARPLMAQIVTQTLHIRAVLPVTTQ